MPDWLVAEIDERRPSVRSRSEHVRDAVAIRHYLEDQDRWDEVAAAAEDARYLDEPQMVDDEAPADD